jgi:mannosyltransferase
MSRTNWIIIVIGLLILAAVVRIASLDRMSLWGDEACMVFLCQTPVDDIVAALSSEDRPDVDVAPPLYFLVLHHWMKIFGPTVSAFRGLSALFGILTVLVAIWMGSLLFDRWTAVILGCLASLNPFQVWYSQEGRMYALAGFLATLTIALFVYSNSDIRKHGRCILFWITSVALMYTQYYGALLLGTLFLFMLFDLRNQPASDKNLHVIRCLATAGVWIIAFIPWIPVFFRDYHHAGEPGGFPSFFHPVISPLFLFIKMTLFGNQAYILDHIWLYAVGGPVCFGLFAFGLKHIRDAGIRLSAACIMIPFLIVYLGSVAGLRIYKSHPFIIFQIPLLAVMAFGLRRLPGRWKSIGLVAVLAMNLFVLSTLTLAGSYVKPRMQDVVDWIAGNYSEGDQVAVLPAFLPNPMPIVGDLLAFKYHSNERFPTRYLCGDDIDEVYRQLTPVQLRARGLFLIYQDNPEIHDEIGTLINRLSGVYKVRLQSRFPSKIRDFTMGVHYFTPMSAPSSDESDLKKRDVTGD